MIKERKAINDLLSVLNSNLCDGCKESKCLTNCGYYINNDGSKFNAQKVTYELARLYKTLEEHKHIFKNALLDIERNK